MDSQACWDDVGLLPAAQTFFHWSQPLGVIAGADKEGGVRLSKQDSIVISSIMAGSSTFWTPKLILDFHGSVAPLRDLTETPVTATYYRDRVASESKDHLISL
jgi:hypothetical protein